MLRQPIPVTAPQRAADPDRWISSWLFIVAAMVGFMVVLGGATRLTESGLSMVSWRPFTGWFPPLTEAEWMAVFQDYRHYPEYQQINQGMSLAEFKGIFWLEYLHRLWGRLIGLAFALPFAVFFLIGWIRGAFAWRCLGLLVLGGSQGVMGWYMVKSGLVDQPDVSQYRLAAHLGLAFIIAGLLVWTGLAVRFDRLRQRNHLSLTRLSRSSLGILAVIAFLFVVVLSGALVAGLNAGMIYNTFPMMAGQLPPPDYLSMQPVWRNIFEDIPSVQFHHRVLAIAALCAVLWIVWREWRTPGMAGLGAKLTGFAVIGQVILGIATLLLVVPIPLAVAHQGGALIVFLCLIWLAFFVNQTTTGVSSNGHKG